MANPEYFVLAAGGTALAAGFAESDGFPDNGYRIVTATAVLAMIASASKGSAVEPLVKAFAILMLLSAVYAYVPAFSKRANTPKRKVKKNG